jgi:DNA-directed RNA polymerase subunit RPC12/RpoP
MRFVGPGQDTRNLRVELYKCPNCGAEVEIFSNEVKVKCYQCGKMVYRERLPSCID